MYITGNFCSKLFISWYEKLLKKIPKNSVLILDNKSIHNKKLVSSISKKYNCNALFLPPYSPDLNPIEHVWGFIKRKIRSFCSFDPNLSLEDALFKSFDFYSESIINH